MINVLVFPCGSEVGLEVNEALKRDKHVRLFGLSSVPCHGKFVFDNYIEGISFISSDTFIDELNAVIDQYDIDVLIPAYDDVILYLSDNRDKLNCRLVTSGAETCHVARSKGRTYQKLEGCDFVPRVYSPDEITGSDLPLFAKPDIGQGSQGAFRIDTLDDLQVIRDSDEEYLICELLPGKEYTVDCFTDMDGEIISMSMRSRNRIRNGISVNTASVPLTDEVRAIGRAINERISFDGVWFFQIKKAADGRFKLLEVAPRVAGSMSLSRVRGFNYILNSVYQTMGVKVSGVEHMLEKIEEDRALSNNYKLFLDYSTVYIDLDDTLIFKDKVNTEAMAFVYQCVNSGKKVKILSRHARREQDTLDKFRIDERLFDEIIHVEDEELKSSYIKEKDAIFIDDSFRERADVSRVNGILVFDIDCIPALTENQ
ncbi:MAG: ATP-grasp domain-containing protein [Mogibacterium sp.]|nr:ATP-grasp domain-containing protein [Mogibacterium sp.]MBQ6501505.1 ATP-grasp domain-containing protein [Mogibacterium sp.]